MLERRDFSYPTSYPYTTVSSIHPGSTQLQDDFPPRSTGCHPIEGLLKVVEIIDGVDDRLDDALREKRCNLTQFISDRCCLGS